MQTSQHRPALHVLAHRDRVAFDRLPAERVAAGIPGPKLVWGLASLSSRIQLFGLDFVKKMKTMGIEQVLSAPRSPWRRAYIERLISSIRRECLDHVDRV